MPKVYIVGADANIASMFLQEGWKLADVITKDVNLIQFTGGEDVDPSYYQETRHPATHSNPKRDAFESAIYHEWAGEIPMAGICRGAQFLNVMNGGKMWQHVNNHAIHGRHEAFYHPDQTKLMVTSTHHQMMIPNENGEVLMTAAIATSKATATQTVLGNTGDDVEAVYYPATQTVCYQPHPEYVGIKDPLRANYYKLLQDFLL